MSFREEDFIDCVGSVNVLLDDRVVLQGQIIKKRHHDEQPQINVEVESENEFITLELTCDAFIIKDNGELETISPALYQDGDIVRINVSEISAIGPSNCCPEEKEDHHHQD